TRRGRYGRTTASRGRRRRRSAPAAARRRQAPARRASARRAGRTISGRTRVGDPLPTRVPYFLAFLLKAATPPALLMISPASGLVRAQSANFCTAGLGLVVGRTRKMYRDSGYFSGSTLMFFDSQVMPFTFTGLMPFFCHAR